MCVCVTQVPSTYNAIAGSLCPLPRMVGFQGDGLPGFLLQATPTSSHPQPTHQSSPSTGGQEFGACSVFHPESGFSKERATEKIIKPLVRKALNGNSLKIITTGLHRLLATMNNNQDCHLLCTWLCVKCCHLSSPSQHGTPSQVWRQHRSCPFPTSAKRPD